MVKKILYIVSLVIAGFAGLLATIFFVGYFGLVPSFRTFIILSGSMEPTLKMGSLAIIAPSDSYLSNDIISFSPDNDKKNIVTHRIVVKLYPEGIDNKPVFLTAGDANKNFDSKKLKQEQIIGKVIFSIPYLGYMANFFKEPYGFILFFIVPVTIIVYEELKTLKKGIFQVIRKFSPKNNGKIEDQGIKLRGKMLLFFPILVAALALASFSVSFFSDREHSVSNSFVAGEWVPTPTPTETPTPTPTPASPVAGSVVINEVMWMGSTKLYADEWIELRNTTSQDIDLSGWQIENATSGDSPLIIPSGKIILANGFFLIVNYEPTHSSSALKETLVYDLKKSNIQIENNYQSNEAIILKDSYGNTIDSTPTPTSSNWPAGFFDGTSGGLHESMERNNDPATGWHTCIDSACNDTIYWDTEGNNYGTPKAANL